jgi:hypothetical protein
MAVFDAVDDAGRISRTLKEFINSRSIPMWAETLNDAKSDDRKTGRSKNGQTLQYRYALHRSDSFNGDRASAAGRLSGPSADITNFPDPLFHFQNRWRARNLSRSVK